MEKGTPNLREFSQLICKTVNSGTWKTLYLDETFTIVPPGWVERHILFGKTEQEKTLDPEFRLPYPVFLETKHSININIFVVMIFAKCLFFFRFWIYFFISYSLIVFFLIIILLVTLLKKSNWIIYSNLLKIFKSKILILDEITLIINYPRTRNWSLRNRPTNSIIYYVKRVVNSIFTSTQVPGRGWATKKPTTLYCYAGQYRPYMVMPWTLLYV